MEEFAWKHKRWTNYKKVTITEWNLSKFHIELMELMLPLLEIDTFPIKSTFICCNLFARCSDIPTSKILFICSREQMHWKKGENIVTNEKMEKRRRIKKNSLGKTAKKEVTLNYCEFIYKIFFKIHMTALKL